MKFFTIVLASLMGLITLTIATDAEAYWHGYRGGWRGGPGWRGPGWGGCYRCGPGWGPGWGAAGVVAGAAAVESAEIVAAESRPAVVVENPPVVVQQAQAPVQAPQGALPPGAIVETSIPPVGATYPNLLPGCVLAPRNGINFYQCQGFRMRPLYGGNSFYYRVVPG